VSPFEKWVPIWLNQQPKPWQNIEQARLNLHEEIVMIAAKDQERHFTPEEYFAWEEQQLERHELIDGRVYAMGGGPKIPKNPKNHSAIAVNCLLLITPHLRGSKCSVFNSDLKVKILDTSNYTYPDLSVTCDDRDRENAFYITYPCLIFEALSDSTEAYDRGKKFEKYRRNPNLVDYVLVSSDETAIDIYHKNDAGDWLILSYRLGDRVELKSIGLSLPIEQFYEENVFEKQS
jgi:Uma2 family endonuclease